MARPKLSLARMWETNPNHISRAILEELTLYAKDKQFYPVQNALLRFMTRPQYNPVTKKLDPARYPDVDRNQFDYWFSRLVSEGYVEIDQPTRSIRCVHLIITDKP